MRQNKLLKIIFVVIVLGAIGLFLFVKSNNKSQEEKDRVSNIFAVYDLTDEEQKKLGFEAGDTFEDTLRTLVSSMKNMRNELASVKSLNEKITKENEILLRLKSQDSSTILDEESKNHLADLEERQQNLKDEVAMQIQSLEMLINENLSAIMKKTQVTETKKVEIPIGGNVNDEPIINNTVMWVQPNSINDPMGANATSNTNVNGETSFFDRIDQETGIGDSVKKLKRERQNNKSYNDGISVSEPKTIPYFTIAKNSTLVGSRAMTALIGRVPINGTINDPFPFKAVIGRENLIANGIQLPDIEGAIISGTTSGDWTLSCVTGRVQSITFVFKDGRITTLPKENNGGGDKEGAIGWISTEQGVPCIHGERKSNALQFLSSSFALAGLTGAGDALAEAQTEKSKGAGLVQAGQVVADSISKVTGDISKFVLGRAIAGGTKEVSQWFSQRYGQTFDAIYVAPNKPIAINITQELRIDYETDARKVNYFNQDNINQLD